MTQRCALVVCAVMFCLTPFSAVADGLVYVPQRTIQSRVPFRWQGTNCVFLLPNSRGTDDLTDGSEFGAIDRAAQRWNDGTANCGFLKLVVQPPSSNANPGLNQFLSNENVIIWIESNWMNASSDEGPLDQGIKAITSISTIDAPSRSDDGRIVDADILLNGEFFIYSAQNTPPSNLLSPSNQVRLVDIENVLVHEFGHLLGLAHTCDDGASSPTPSDNQGNTPPDCRVTTTKSLSQVEAGLAPEVIAATMYNRSGPAETSKRSPEAVDLFGICDTYPLAQDPMECLAPKDSQVIGCGSCAMQQGSYINRVPKSPVMWISGLLLAFVLIFRRRMLSRRR